MSLEKRGESETITEPDVDPRDCEPRPWSWVFEALNELLNRGETLEDMKEEELPVSKRALVGTILENPATLGRKWTRTVGRYEGEQEELNSEIARAESIVEAEAAFVSHSRLEIAWGLFERSGLGGELLLLSLFIGGETERRGFGC